MDAGSVAVERVFKEERGRIVATLIRLLGDFDAAEEALSAALEAALAQWPRAGVPDNPRAWLIRAARNKAADVARHERIAARKRAALEADLAPEDKSVLPPDERDALMDDRLSLIFTCCHPSLAVDAQVALTLRTLGGLSTEEIARAFLVPPATMAQRLVRAKQKIRAARIPYRVPDADDLPERIDAVTAVVYLVFNEGYSATSGDALTRLELAAEAIRLARVLCELMPSYRGPRGLLALMLLQDSRREARTDAAGDLVLLEEQDRRLWDAAQIAEGLELVARVLAEGAPDGYAIQAAIAAVHARASGAGDTDWAQIAALYARLHALHPSPVIALNHAVAVAMCEGPAAGLRLIERLEPALAGYHLLPAARADLLRRLGRHEEAARAYGEALAKAGTDAERRFLQRRLRELAAT